MPPDANLVDTGHGWFPAAMMANQDFFNGLSEEEVLVGHHGGGEPAVPGVDQVRGDLVEAAGLDPEDGVLLAVEDAGLQAAIDLAPGQRRGAGAEGAVGGGEQWVGHGADVLDRKSTR